MSYACGRCPWSGVQLSYVSFDVMGDRFTHLPFGQAVCPECGVCFAGALHPDAHTLLELGVLDARVYTIRTRFTVENMQAVGLDAEDLHELIWTIRQNLPFTRFEWQIALGELDRKGKTAYADDDWITAYSCVADAFELFETARPHELYNLMRSFGLSERIGVQRLINLPPVLESASFEHRDFGRFHVRDVYELRPGEVFGLVALHRDRHVVISITSDPYTLCGEWAVKFRFTDPVYAKLGEQVRFLCELGMTPYTNGKWSTSRHLIVLPEGR